MEVAFQNSPTWTRSPPMKAGISAPTPNRNGELDLTSANVKLTREAGPLQLVNVMTEQLCQKVTRLGGSLEK
jgi:hypothetical protein